MLQTSLRHKIAPWIRMFHKSYYFSGSKCNFQKVCFCYFRYKVAEIPTGCISRSIFGRKNTSMICSCTYRNTQIFLNCSIYFIILHWDLKSVFAVFSPSSATTCTLHHWSSDDEKKPTEGNTLWTMWSQDCRNSKHTERHTEDTLTLKCLCLHCPICILWITQHSLASFSSDQKTEAPHTRCIHYTNIQKIYIKYVLGECGEILIENMLCAVSFTDCGSILAIYRAIYE